MSPGGRVSAVQFRPHKFDVDRNRERLVALVSEAATASDLVVTPEMSNGGYRFTSVEQAKRVCEPSDGPLFQALSRTARQHEIHIVAGYGEACGEQLFNSAMVIAPTGELLFNYRKTLLFYADEVWAQPGDSGYFSFETETLGRVGLGICMDINDPRFILWMWRQRLDVLAFPTNWVEEGLDVHHYWNARLNGCDVALVAANSYGPDGDMAFSGRSGVLRRGAVLAAAGPTGDGWVATGI